jgi:uncharacterized protein (TIRG00374 family)
MPMTDQIDQHDAVGVVGTTVARLRRGARLFSSSTALPRARRATDVLLAVVSVIALVAIGISAVPEPTFARAVTTMFRALPPALSGLWQWSTDLLAIWAIVLVVASFATRRLAIGRDMVLAVLLGTGLWMVVARTVGGDWPELISLVRDAAPPVAFPPARLAVPAAMIVTASPHLVRPARRFGQFVIAAGSIGAIAIGASSTLGALAALFAATCAAALVHLAVGSSAGRPSIAEVGSALADMRIPIVSMGLADRQEGGTFTVEARSVDGDDLVIKLYGRDAHDAALVSTVWRTIWLRQPGTPVGFGRLRQVEHEALLTLLAAQAGVRTDGVVVAGATRSSDAILVLSRRGAPIVAPNRFSEGEHGTAFANDEAIRRVAELWTIATSMHDAGIVHGQIDEDHLVMVDDAVGVIDFRGASVAPTPAQFGNDDAQVLLTSIGLAGRAQAIDGLVEHRSPDQIEQLLPYLQPSALTADQRQMIKVLEVDLDELRADVAAAAGVESPPLVQLRRLTVGAVARVALPALAITVLISALAGFDVSGFVDALREASWWLVATGFVIAQLPRIAQAVSTLGAAPIPLPLGPVYALQLAISYVNLAIPTAASRIAVNVRFFQRQGVPPSAAIATGALDGVSGFIVQILVLGSILLLSSLSVELDIDGPVAAALNIMWILVVVVAAVVVVAMIVPRLRRYVLDIVRRTLSEALGVLRGLRSPRRLAMLFGGNLVAEILFALALGVFVQAFGTSLPLHELLFVNMTVALLGGLVPVPGGIGVTEGGLIVGLSSFGVPQEAAFAAVITYRIATFYLPPIWGFFSLRWLERNRYL